MRKSGSFASRLLTGIMNGGSLLVKQQEKMHGEMALSEAEDRIRRDGHAQKIDNPCNEFERELNGVIILFSSQAQSDKIKLRFVCEE